MSRIGVALAVPFNHAFQRNCVPELGKVIVCSGSICCQLLPPSIDTDISIDVWLGIEPTSADSLTWSIAKLKDLIDDVTVDEEEVGVLTSVTLPSPYCAISCFLEVHVDL